MQLPLLELCAAVLHVDHGSPAASALQQELAMDIAAHRLKTIYHHLGASPELAHATLRLLTAASRSSASAAARFIDGFDFGLKALFALGRLPKCVGNCHVWAVVTLVTSHAPTTEGPTQALLTGAQGRSWWHGCSHCLSMQIQAEPPSALIHEYTAIFFQSVYIPLLSPHRLLRVRNTTHLLLNSLASDPCSMARAVVQCVWWHAQAAGHLLWSDACLKQVCAAAHARRVTHSITTRWQLWWHDHHASRMTTIL